MDSATEKVLLVVTGAIAGLLTALLGPILKTYLDRRVESDKVWADRRLKYLDPLCLAAEELKASLAHLRESVSKEKDIPEDRLQQFYNVRWWLKHCKDYIVVEDNNWTDAQRLEDFAMHSGGAGNEAISSLYVAAYYLYYATRILTDLPSVRNRHDKREVISSYVRDVRSKFSQLEYYAVTQDSTGLAMRNSSGEVLNFREFGEAITARSKRGWFLTLTDVYFKMHKQKVEDINALIRSLEALIDSAAETRR